MVVIMCLLSETSPICGSDSKVPTKSDRADSSLDKVSSSGQAKKKGHQKPLRKRKPKRVLYPAQVRKYLPRQEKDKAKKWLLILGAIVFFQIFIEDDGHYNHEVHKTLAAHDSNAGMFLGHANTTVDSRPPLAGQGPKNVIVGNATMLNFVTGSRGTLDSILSRSTYYDRRNDFA